MTALVALNRPDAVRAHVVTLPYAGGGGAALRDWAPSLPAGLALWGVRLPGRESRLDEPPYRDVAQASTPLAEELSTLDGPIALFGHSFGALLAHRLGVELTARGLPPVLVGLSGLGPEAPRPGFADHVDDDELIRRLAELGGTPPAVLADPSLMRATLPAIRADLAAARASMPVTGPPLAGPVALFGGRDDPDAGRAQLLGWRALATGELSLRLFPGGHFFALTGAVARAFAGDVDRCLR